VAELLIFHDVSIQIGNWGRPEGEFKILPHRQIELAQYAAAPWSGVLVPR
jgi:hypothetical protein